MERQVPTLSLGDYVSGSMADRQRFVEGLFAGIKNYGFIILKDHGVQTSVLGEAYEMLKHFFALSEEEKRKYISKFGGGQRGYTPFGTEHAKNSELMDLKEFWHVGRELPEGHAMANRYPPNIWPTELPEFKPVFLKLYQDYFYIFLSYIFIKRPPALPSKILHLNLTVFSLVFLHKK